MSQTRWVLLTGEYPPQPGGVSDYTRLVAHGLAEAGDEVHVWAPAGLEFRNSAKSASSLRFAPAPSNPAVHGLPGKFGPRDLEILDRALSRLPKPFRLVVQYVPHAFGAKGMNVPFCWWLSRRPEPVWIMFHEVAFGLSRCQPLAHKVLGIVTQFMADLVARKAERIFVSIPAWEKMLPKRIRKPVTWLPVPSNIPTQASVKKVAEIRRRIAPRHEVILGHFGTYAGHVTSLLAPNLPSILRKDRGRRLLLLGRGSDAFAALLGNENPELRNQIEATGPLRAEDIAAHLAACDCVFQPYEDGVCSRHASLLASLALGLPIVTNQGPLTDPIWNQTNAVVLAPSSSRADLLEAVEGLLAEPESWIKLGHRAADFYQEYFALARTIQTLRREAGNYKLAS